MLMSFLTAGRKKAVFVVPLVVRRLRTSEKLRAVSGHALALQSISWTRDVKYDDPVDPCWYGVLLGLEPKRLKNDELNTI